MSRFEVHIGNRILHDSVTEGVNVGRGEPLGVYIVSVSVLVGY